MSFATSEGKDMLIFTTKEDHESTDKVEIPEESPGIVYPSGEINWDCPCLGDLPNGPCGKEFRTAFSCFHFSKAVSKGSDCIDTFRDMQDCFMAHPEIYGDDEDEEESTDINDGSKDINEGKTDIDEKNTDINEGNVDINKGEINGDKKVVQQDS